MNVKSAVENAGTVVLALCAVLVTGLVVRRELVPPVDSRVPQPPVVVKQWRSFVAGDMRIGPAHSAVTIIEFSDFECPYCKKLFYGLDSIRRAHPTDATVVYRNFPLTQLHSHARAAAIAAACAALQGKFPAYHDSLFARQGSLASFGWVAMASRVGIADTTAYRKCLTGTEVLAMLRSDSLAGDALEVTGTPTVLVNEWRFSGTPTRAHMEQFVVSELARLKR